MKNSTLFIAYTLPTIQQQKELYYFFNCPGWATRKQEKFPTWTTSIELCHSAEA
jgi:hypothetical protein